MTKLKTDFNCYACKSTKPFHRFNCWLGVEYYQGWLSNICSACFKTLGPLGELKAIEEVISELEGDKKSIKLTCAAGAERGAKLRELSTKIRGLENMKKQILDGTAKLENEFSDCTTEVCGSDDWRKL